MATPETYYTPRAEKEEYYTPRGETKEEPTDIPRDDPEDPSAGVDPDVPPPPEALGEKGMALVTGATGLVGRHLVMYLATLQWTVYPVSRHAIKGYDEVRDLGPRVKPIEVTNLTDKQAVRHSLKDIDGVTHFFHTALASTGDLYKDDELNHSMMVNVIEALEWGPSKSSLKHVYLQTGSKWYGLHLGMLKSPAREDDPLTITPNFYYPMQRYLEDRVNKGASWSWSSLRPNPIIGYSPGSYMNLLTAIGAYAAITERLGLPFRFPGTPAAYDAAWDCCDASMLAEAITFVATTPEAANKAYNVSNGDIARWSEVWPHIAKNFKLKQAPPQKFSLEKFMNMPDKKQAWHDMMQQYGLIIQDVARFAAWDFADLCFSLESDAFLNVTKLGRAGFKRQCLDTPTMFVDELQRLIDIKAIPPLGEQELAPEGPGAWADKAWAAPAGAEV